MLYLINIDNGEKMRTTYIQFGKTYKLSYDPKCLESRKKYLMNLGLNTKDFSNDELNSLINYISNDTGEFNNRFLEILFNLIYECKGFSFDFTTFGHELTVRKNSRICPCGSVTEKSEDVCNQCWEVLNG